MIISSGNFMYNTCYNNFESTGTQKGFIVNEDLPKCKEFGTKLAQGQKSL